MTLKSALTNVFTAKSKIDLETVSTRLADAQAALHAAEEAHAAGALLAALDDNPHALDEIEARLSAARRRAESLETAFAEASRVEGQRLSKVKSDAERARLNACRQHGAAAARSAQKVSDALAAAIGAYHDLLKEVAKVEKLLTGRERTMALGSGTAPNELKRMTLTELSRLARQWTDIEPLAFPGAQFGTMAHSLPHGQSLMDVVPLADRVRQRFQVADFIGGLAPAVDVLEEKPMPSADDPQPPIADELSAEDIAALTAAQEAGAVATSAKLQDAWYDARSK